MNDFESQVETKAGTSREMHKGTTSFQRPMPPKDGVTLLARFMPTKRFKDLRRKTPDIGRVKSTYFARKNPPFVHYHKSQSGFDLFRTIISFSKE